MPFKLNSFYDTAFTTIEVRVPSKQDDFVPTKELGKYFFKEDQESVKKFKKLIKTFLPHQQKLCGWNWPLPEPLLTFMQIGLKKKDFEERDVDNMAKTVLDSMKNIVYKDDSFVTTLIVQKFIDNKWPSLTVGIKCLNDSNPCPVNVPEIFILG